MEENSLVDVSKIMGREEDKKALLGKLLRTEEGDENVKIVSIIGMGGIGKTTLAKVLYNEEKVKDSFEVRAWVSVSEEFDVFNISMAIFQAVTGEIKDFASLDLLHVALKEKLSKKRFLIVLDDVWNEDHSKWELLYSLLQVGARGTTIIVTTRSTTVASVMDSKEVYGLEVLSDEDALSLFAQFAIGEKTFDKYPTLNLLGEGMVHKCDRLPLALKTLGRVLKGNRDGDEWEKLLKSEIWDIEDGRKILPALRLSYYHLPPHLKQLFAYCSLIPKDCVFDKNKLVLLWMAEGFLSQSKGNKSIECLGHQYFDDLKSRSFFQHSTNCGEFGYTMHDLINDLAISVAGEFSFRSDVGMDVSENNVTFDKLRHFSLISSRSESLGKLKELQRAKRLHTFIVMSVDSINDSLLDDVLVELLPELHFLRVLSFMELTPSHYVQRRSKLLMITKVPKSIGKLKHLRYLNVSHTEITCLPEEVSDLYNLQSLLAHNCYELSSLPETFVNLINLRHLDISNTPKMNKMPLGMAQLTGLQTLSKVIVEGTNRFKISDLKGLSDLQGLLIIIGLDKVIDPKQATDADLCQKKGLDVLQMKWSYVFNDSRNEIIEYEVLKELRPPYNLKNLIILNNKGKRFPSWVGDPSFYQLTDLKLGGCQSTQLPTLGHLRTLKKLVVERMNEVKSVGFELLAPTDSFQGIAFPSLEVLKFNDMQSWQKWSINIGGDHGTRRSFPCLHVISIMHCPKLAQVSIGLIPSLRVLWIEECSKEVLRSMVGSSSSLVKLNIWNVKALTHLHGEDLMHLRAVEELYINECDELIYLWERDSEACKSLVSLQKLKVLNCKNLVSSPEKEFRFGMGMGSLKHVVFDSCDTLESYSCPNNVEMLEIKSCGSMTSLTFSTMQEHPSSLSESRFSDYDSIRTMSCLTSLHISHCDNLKSIPHECFQSLTSLEKVCVQDCPSMDHSFPCGLWPPSLRKLRIGGLNKPMSEWGVQNFPTSLVELELTGSNSGVISFAVADDVRNTTTATPSSTFLLPPSLVSLTLNGFKDVESFSEVLQQLPCLKTLYIVSCQKIRDLKTTHSPSLTISILE